eukprot:51530-Eustigmatos_ZCMA.PRE.1
MSPNSFLLVLKTHLTPITLAPSGRSHNVHVLLLSNDELPHPLPASTASPHHCGLDIVHAVGLLTRIVERL